MAGENDAEKKNIAKLDFNISDALNSLEKIDSKLKEIAKTSEKYSETIGKSLNGSIIKNTIANDVQEVNKSIKLTENQQRIVEKNRQIEVNKTAEVIKRQNNAAANNVIENNKKIEQSTKTLGDKISEYAKTYVIYQGFNQLKQAIGETIDEMVEMENQMVAINRVMDVSNLDRYRDQLIQLAHDYGNTFNNVADITLRLAQAGFDEQEALALTQKTLLALNTADLDAKQATDDMVAVMAQWGLMTGTAAEQAKSYGDIVDKVNKVADNFPTTSADIMDALKKTSSAFNLAGASIDETIAIIVSAEKASQRGGKAIGTAMSNIVQQLKETKKIGIAEDLGISFYTDKTKTEFKGIIDIFKELSEKMQQLKNEGKENSVEMQNLLSIFTVFRRNIGASLLGEMDSTYLDVYNAALTSTGYSLEENAKYMQTAKAAQAQFNAELLKLKTEVWDNGLEDTFRGILSLGTDIVGGLRELIKTFGIAPVSIGTLVAAFTVLNKNFQGFSMNTKTGKIELAGFMKNISDATKEVRNTNNVTALLTNTVGGNTKAFVKNSLEVGKYTTKLIASTLKTVALEVATIALNAAITMGLSVAISAIAVAIDNWINAEEKAIQKSKEMQNKAEENASTLGEEVTTIQELRKEYEELAKKDNRTTEENQRVYELQTKINDAIKSTGVQVDLINEKVDEQGKTVLKVNENYNEQLSILKSIEYQKKKNQVQELKEAMESAKKASESSTTDIQGNNFQKLLGGTSMAEAFVKAGISEGQKTIWGGTNDISINPQMYEFNNSDLEKQIELLNNWKRKLEAVNDGNEDVKQTLEKVSTALKTLKERQENVNNTTANYKNALSELYQMSGQIDTFNTFLDSISKNYKDQEGPQQLINNLKDINQQFSDGKINIEDYFNKIQEKIKSIDLSAEGKDLEAYQAIFAATTSSVAEGIESLMGSLQTGYISFVEYADGIKESAETTLDLFAKQNGLVQDQNGLWTGGSEELNAYANGIQETIDTLNEYSDVLKAIGDNYDYIAEHANAAGEAAFVAADTQSKEYQKLASDLTTSFNKMKDDNIEAFNSLTKSIADNIGISTNDMYDANGYLSEGFLNQYKNMNGTLNATASATQVATQRVTTSMGNVLTKLGEAIKSFSYNITATPKITGSFGIEKNSEGFPTGLKLPSFGFDITGSGGSSVQDLGAALTDFGTSIQDYGNIKFGYSQLSKQGPFAPKGASSGSGSSGGGSGSKSGGSSSKSTVDHETQAEEQAYKKRLQAFKDYMTQKEKIENKWVNNYKDLEQLSTNDFLVITQERIKRYQEYLDAIKNATWMNAEDRAELEATYTEKITDAQVEYFKYLKTRMQDEISELKKNNTTKIDAIKDEATARINALKKVKSEEDRIKKEREYEDKRKDALDDISYWEQRTGREAQEALVEARKKLAELDEDWKETQEGWNTDDQIEAIEKERDAQVKAIEDEQEAQIKAWEDAYAAKVKLFAETGQIIYEGTQIESEALFNTYKQKFIDPIKNELANLNKVETPAPASTATPQQQYENYIIKRGDTLSKIASNYGTTVEKIMAANPYITNKNRIYAGKSLQIPKFHDGGEVGGNKEGFALLKPGEVVWTPEWSARMERFSKYLDNAANNNFVKSGPSIAVTGDMIHIDAAVRNQTDIDQIGKKVESILKDKFNIKK